MLSPGHTKSKVMCLSFWALESVQAGWRTCPLPKPGSPSYEILAWLRRDLCRYSLNAESQRALLALWETREAGSQSRSHPKPIEAVLPLTSSLAPFLFLGPAGGCDKRKRQRKSQLCRTMCGHTVGLVALPQTPSLIL